MPCDSPYTVDRGPAHALGQRNVAVPCGRCAICKRNRINQWVFRLQQEDKHAKKSYFITLTYNSDTIPISSKGFRTLRKSDYQKFMKRLRKKLPKVKIRYYAVGEYGSKTMRPHYHAIIFNIPDEEFIKEAWQLGDVDIGTVSGASIAYTAKYIDKDSKIPMHANDDRVKEFSLMSKGLGKQYLTKAMVSYHKKDLKRQFVTTQQGHKVPMPRYYKNRIYTEDELTALRFLSKVASEENRIKTEKEYYQDHSHLPNPNHFHKEMTDKEARFIKQKTKKDDRDTL